MYGRPRFLPRIYHRNYLIGSALYTDAITDLNIRRGRPAYCSSSTSSYGYSYPDRFNVFRDDMRLHDDIYSKTSSRLVRDRLRHKSDVHDRLVGWHSPNYMPLHSVRGYHLNDVPFSRRMYPIEPVKLHSQHAAHGKFMENRRLRFMHELWQHERDEEGRHRIRSFYNKSGAPPQIPHHRLFTRPPAVYQLFY
ncbi:uncharacterized protein LOC100901653 [Galendromus occidentalis]|uniref:Uncharacterized protein LOC100901653 n=1 Tax=Galendromus occidentalis TaxID=34638 RepID=A0AAJ7PAN9_9ACAR|nr:uncharacterized protein LOC100901653 [Galendromus occidentalis]